MVKIPRPPGCNGGVCYCNHYDYCNDRSSPDMSHNLYMKYISGATIQSTTLNAHQKYCLNIGEQQISNGILKSSSFIDPMYLIGK